MEELRNHKEEDRQKKEASKSVLIFHSVKTTVEGGRKKEGNRREGGLTGVRLLEDSKT